MVPRTRELNAIVVGSGITVGVPVRTLGLSLRAVHVPVWLSEDSKLAVTVKEWSPIGSVLGIDIQKFSP